MSTIFLSENTRLETASQDEPQSCRHAYHG